MKKVPGLKSLDLNQFKRLIYRIDIHLKHNLFFILALTIYTILAISLFNYYQYIVTVDGISYISIAQNYVIGDVSNAINGYWSPLFSWLLTPFLLFGSTKIYIIHSARILSLIISFFTLFGIKFLFSKFITDEKINNISIFVMIPTVLYFAFYLNTPDLLLVCILLFYLGLIFDPKYSFQLRNGFACGFLGALAYFSKSYAFIFFICHFIIFNIFFYFNELDYAKKNKVKKNLILGLTVFLALSGIWIGLISDKYGEITIGTSGTYNQGLVGPESSGHPPLYQGLIKPPNENAVSAWEDPSYFEIKSWNPLESVNSFIFELNLIWYNIMKTANIFLSFSFLSILILLTTIFFIKSQKDTALKRHLTYLFVTIFIYTAGYCLILVESRYLWIISILIFLLALCLFELLYKNDIIKIRIRNLLLVILIASFIIMPINGLIDSVDIDKNIHYSSNTLKECYNVHGNLASNDDWMISLILTYYLNGTYYGITKNTYNLNELETELQDNNIDYYLVWGTNQTNLPYNEITNGKIDHLKVYQIKNPV
jgi:hypothetical protein